MGKNFQTSGRASRRPPISVFAAMLLAAGLIGLLVYGMSARGSGGDTIDSALAEGRTVPAPAVRLSVLGSRRAASSSLQREAVVDGRLDLTELRGSAVVVNFWASWCDPCRREMPLLQRTAARERRGVTFVGVNMQDVASDARDFLRRYRVDYLNVRDPSDETARRWGTRGIPETFFVDAEGRVVAHAVGEIAGRELDRGIAAARSGEPVDLAAGR